MGWRHSGEFGRRVYGYQRIRGEYPTVAAGLGIRSARCKLEAAWYTPILSEKKARRTLERLKQRLVPILQKERDDLDRAGMRDTAADREHEAERVKHVGLVVADKVPCGRGAAGCYSPKDNKIYFRSQIFDRPRGFQTVFDPFTHNTHGALIHELAHAATRGKATVTTYFRTEAPGVISRQQRIRRDVHGARFVRRLRQLAEIWCETEGKKVCDFYCAPRFTGPPIWAEQRLRAAEQRRKEAARETVSKASEDEIWRVR